MNDRFGAEIGVATSGTTLFSCVWCISSGAWQGSAREGVEHTKDEAKTLYENAKDTIQGWLGGKQHEAREVKDDVDRAVEGTQDSISGSVHKASDKVPAFSGMRCATCRASLA